MAKRMPLALAALLGVLVLGFALRAAGAAEPPAKRAGHPAVGMLLRLHDLPPGYKFLRPFEGDSDQPAIVCAALDPGEPEPKVKALVERYSPAGCLSIFVRTFTVPGGTPAPILAGAGVLDRRSAESAATALALTPQLLGHLIGDQMLHEAPPPQPIGEETRLFHWNPGEFFGGSAGLRAASFLSWRSGGVAAIVFATGRSAARADAAALAFAQRQQLRIEAPSPYTRAERDDLEVLLDNPKLKSPTLWLGRGFNPGRGFDRLHLLQAQARPFAPREEDTFLLYTDKVLITSRTERAWDPKREGPRGLGWDCTVARRIELPQGFATIYGGYQQHTSRCPHRPPHVFSAVVHSHGMATVIEVQVHGRRLGAKGGYDSFRGLATLARGLRVRPRPSY